MAGGKVASFRSSQVLIQTALAAELIAAGQTDPTWCYSATVDFSEHLALESGRPMLIILHSGGD
jgi:hypothetical protein